MRNIADRAITGLMTGVLLSFGHGYSARALARLLLPHGWQIIGTTRDAGTARSLRASGVEPLIWPASDRDLGAALARATHLLSSVPPGPQGDPVLAVCAAQIACAGLEWAGYLSSTGVYGPHDGAVVDETTPLVPGTARGQARARAEAEWRAVPGQPLHVFRLAGIYGPGRSALDKVRQGTARRIIKRGQVFSRIHVADIAKAIAHSIAQPRPDSTYNIADDEPAPPQDVIAYAAGLLGAPVPPDIPFADADLSPMARSFYAESRRVSAEHIKRDLGFRPLYPNYRAGLAAILAGEGAA